MVTPTSRDTALTSTYSAFNSVYKDEIECFLGKKLLNGSYSNLNSFDFSFRDDKGLKNTVGIENFKRTATQLKSLKNSLGWFDKLIYKIKKIVYRMFPGVDKGLAKAKARRDIIKVEYDKYKKAMKNIIPRPSSASGRIGMGVEPPYSPIDPTLRAESFPDLPSEAEDALLMSPLGTAVPQAFDCLRENLYGNVDADLEYEEGFYTIPLNAPKSPREAENNTLQRLTDFVNREHEE
jgi:hypothetical protein